MFTVSVLTVTVFTVTVLTFVACLGEEQTPRIPFVGVAAGPHIFIYCNMRPASPPAPPWITVYTPFCAMLTGCVLVALAAGVYYSADCDFSCPR